MKDFIFQGTDINVTYRTDAIDTQNTNTGNFTVHEIRGLDNIDINRTEEKELLVAFKQLVYDYNEFINFAETWGLRLTERDTNGGNEEVLVVETGSESVSGVI